MSKPPLAQWIVEQRRAKSWKLEELARRLREAGYEAADTTVRTWEAGRRPHPGTIRALELLFDKAAPREREEPDMAALLARLDAQVETMNRAVDVIGELSAGLAKFASALAISDVERTARVEQTATMMAALLKERGLEEKPVEVGPALARNATEDGPRPEKRRPVGSGSRA